jgi:hypothetical protein
LCLYGVAQEIEQAKDKEEEERPGNKEWLPKHLLVAYIRTLSFTGTRI